jgi:hypothetical protein
MDRKGYVSEVLGSARILSHGKIRSLESAFSLRKGVPFSIFIIPVDDEEWKPLEVNCKLYQDDASTGCPFNLRCWNEPAISEIAAGAIDLDSYDVHWGTGADVEES